MTRVHTARLQVLNVEHVDQLPCFRQAMPMLHELSFTIARRLALVTFPEAMTTLLPALQRLRVAGDGWGGLVVEVPASICVLPNLSVVCTACASASAPHVTQGRDCHWQVYSSPRAHHATYRPRARGWSVQVQCDLGEVGDALDVGGAVAFLQHVERWPLWVPRRCG